MFELIYKNRIGNFDRISNDNIDWIIMREIRLEIRALMQITMITINGSSTFSIYNIKCFIKFVLKKFQIYDLLRHRWYKSPTRMQFDTKRRQVGRHCGPRMIFVWVIRHFIRSAHLVIFETQPKWRHKGSLTETKAIAEGYEPFPRFIQQKKGRKEPCLWGFSRVRYCPVLLCSRLIDIVPGRNYIDNMTFLY